jgi:hypothetical protein
MASARLSGGRLLISKCTEHFTCLAVGWKFMNFRYKWTCFNFRDTWNGMKRTIVCVLLAIVNHKALISLFFISNNFIRDSPKSKYLT